ncbi:hypothetical protein R1sor_027097 [Riccia sorocarpa]|uniref:Uncharacterized protein n=1 Tax=Riccia sorocarpa TaxID=122646 RepID=A0ABD3GJ07_9MARC
MEDQEGGNNEDVEIGHGNYVNASEYEKSDIGIDIDDSQVEVNPENEVKYGDEEEIAKPLVITSDLVLCEHKESGNVPII